MNNTASHEPPTKLSMSLRPGLIAGASSYILWGFVPLYFAAVSKASSLEILCHRIIWSTVFLLIYLKFKKSLNREKLTLLLTKKNLKGLIATTILISANWLIFIYAVSTNQTLESSLGYFICPLVVIGLGVVFLKERLSLGQIVSLVLVFLGVGYLLAVTGRLPWISLSLAFTFAIYGLVRKTMSVDAIPGLFIETALVTPLAIAYLTYLGWKGELIFLNEGIDFSLLLISAGLITSIPLVLFTEGARRLDYSTMGFLQYITPSLHFYVAVSVFKEPLSHEKLISFIIIWVGLILFVLDSAKRAQKLRKKVP